MAIYVKTDNPQNLLDKVKKTIDEGKVQSWMYDEDGDFQHSPKILERGAWLRPVVTEKYLILAIVKPKNEELSTLTYAAYHGQFIEMMLRHFDKLFDTIFASSQKTKYDIF